MRLRRRHKRRYHSHPHPRRQGRGCQAGRVHRVFRGGLRQNQIDLNIWSFGAYISFFITKLSFFQGGAAKRVTSNSCFGLGGITVFDVGGIE